MLVERISGPVSAYGYDVMTLKQKRRILLLGDWHFKLSEGCTPCTPERKCVDVIQLLDSAFLGSPNAQFDFFMEVPLRHKHEGIASYSDMASYDEDFTVERVGHIARIFQHYAGCFAPHKPLLAQLAKARNPKQRGKLLREFVAQVVPPDDVDSLLANQDFIEDIQAQLVCLEKYKNVRFHYGDPRDGDHLFSQLDSLQEYIARPSIGVWNLLSRLFGREHKLLGAFRKDGLDVVHNFVAYMDNFIYSDRLDVSLKHYRIRPEKGDAFLVREDNLVFSRVRKQLRKLQPAWQKLVEDYYEHRKFVWGGHKIELERVDAEELPHDPKARYVDEDAFLRYFCIFMDVYIVARMLYFLGFGNNKYSKPRLSKTSIVYAGDAHIWGIREFFAFANAALGSPTFSPAFSAAPTQRVKAERCTKFARPTKVM